MGVLLAVKVPDEWCMNRCDTNRQSESLSSTLFIIFSYNGKHLVCSFRS